MNASRIDSLVADYADENGCVSVDKVFEVFSQCLGEDALTMHEIEYGFTDEESLWESYCEDTELDWEQASGYVYIVESVMSMA